MRIPPARTICLTLLLPLILASPDRVASGAAPSSQEDDPTPASSAAPPAPCPAPEARAFDFWHGEWKVNNRYRTPDGWRDAGAADVRVYPALSGCLTIEHWKGTLGPNSMLGFSARAWYPDESKWVLLLNWPQPRRSTFGTLEGTFRHGRGEFFSTFSDAEGETVHQRFSFADITPERFRWDQATADGPDGPWLTTWIMEYSRRDPLSDPPIFVEPATDVARCDAPEYRQFDFLLGDWDATTDIPRRDGSVHRQRASMRSVPILGGCAVMDFWTTHGEDPEFQAFRIRAYDEAVGHWVQYWYDTVEKIFQRFEGGVQENGSIVLVYTTGDRLDRITWSEVDSPTPHWEYAMSFDGGDSWREHANARLER